MTYVYKNTGIEVLDDFFGGSAEQLEANFAYGLDLMNKQAAQFSRTVEKLEEEHHVDVGGAEQFDAYWLGSQSQLAGKEVARVLRRGYEQAIELATSLGKPIETFFVTAAVNDFEVHVCEGRYAVTVFMFVPLARKYGSKNAISRSWVVRVGTPDDDEQVVLDEQKPNIVSIQVSGPKVSET